MMSNNWSIFLSENGWGKLQFGSQFATIEYVLDVYQAVLYPDLFTAKCRAKVIGSNLSVLPAINQPGESILLGLSNGERFEASIDLSQSQPGMGIYVLNVRGTDGAWKQKRDINRNK